MRKRKESYRSQEGMGSRTKVGEAASAGVPWFYYHLGITAASEPETW